MVTCILWDLYCTKLINNCDRTLSPKHIQEELEE